jgi:hypothetical protein
MRTPHPGQSASPGGTIFNQNQAAAEKRRAARKAQHKKRQIAKRDRNNDRNKRRKAGEQGVSSDEDPSPEPSWSGDVASAAVNWSNMSRSSSSSPPRGAEVSSSRRLREAGSDKTVGSSSRPAAPPAPSGPAVRPLPYDAQRDGRFRAAETCAPSRRSSEKVRGAIGVCPSAL